MPRDQHQPQLAASRGSTARKTSRTTCLFRLLGAAGQEHDVVRGEAGQRGRAAAWPDCRGRSGRRRTSSSRSPGPSPAAHPGRGTARHRSRPARPAGRSAAAVGRPAAGSAGSRRSCARSSRPLITATRAPCRRAARTRFGHSSNSASTSTSGRTRRMAARTAQLKSSGQ